MDINSQKKITDELKSFIRVIKKLSYEELSTPQEPEPYLREGSVARINNFYINKLKAIHCMACADSALIDLTLLARYDLNDILFHKPLKPFRIGETQDDVLHPQWELFLKMLKDDSFMKDCVIIDYSNLTKEKLLELISLDFVQDYDYDYIGDDLMTMNKFRGSIILKLFTDFIYLKKEFVEHMINQSRLKYDAFLKLITTIEKSDKLEEFDKKIMLELTNHYLAYVKEAHDKIDVEEKNKVLNSKSIKVAELIDITGIIRNIYSYSTLSNIKKFIVSLEKFDSSIKYVDELQKLFFPLWKY